MKTCGVDPSRGVIGASFVENMIEFDYQEYENSPKGFKKFVKKIKFQESISKVCIEGYGDSAKQLAIYLKAEGLKVYEINPLMVSRLRDSMTEHKTDHIDAYTCALFPYLRTDLKELTLDVGIEGLRNLSRLYEKISKQVTQLKNQLHAALNQGFGPVYKKMFEKFNKTSITFYIKYSSYEEIDKSSVSEIHNTLKLGGSCMYKGKHGLKKAKRIKEIIKEINYSTLNVFMKMQSQVIKSYGKILLSVIEEKERVKREIEEYVRMSFPDFKEYFGGIKGLTDLEFGRLISEIKDINKYKKDSHLASYAGQSPKQFQSASMNKPKDKRRYNRHLAHIIHQLTCDNIREGTKFYEDYIEMKKRYSKKLRAMKNIKRKMVRFLFYDLKQYAEHLKEISKNGEILHVA